MEAYESRGLDTTRFYDVPQPEDCIYESDEGDLCRDD